MVRFKNDRHIMYEFVHHYLEEGVDHFIFIDDNSNDNFINLNKSWMKPLIDKNIIKIVKSAKTQGNSYNKYVNLAKKYKWLIVCDSDEFMFGVNKTIKQLLLGRLSKYNYISITLEIIYTL